MQAHACSGGASGHNLVGKMATADIEMAMHEAPSAMSTSISHDGYPPPKLDNLVITQDSIDQTCMPKVLKAA